MTFDKVLGNFLGISIGDALGKPVETFTAKQIADEYGIINKYHDCKFHKYFANDPKGTTTDDWQLTKAIANALIKVNDQNNGVDDDSLLKSIAEEHIKEYNISDKGWGGSTRESVQRMISGVHWTESAKSQKPNRGFGNGICMKISPIALYLCLKRTENTKRVTYFNNKIPSIATMTHDSQMAVISGLAHTVATMYCFDSMPEDFSKEKFINVINEASSLGKEIQKDYSYQTKDDIVFRFDKLKSSMQSEEIISEFGGGSCYVFNSLPFTYAFFLKNPHNIDSLYECISAGGDTDTNGAMLGGLLGTLHGSKIFPQHLIDDLRNKEEVYSIAEKFYKAFGNT